MALAGHGEQIPGDTLSHPLEPGIVTARWNGSDQVRPVTRGRRRPSCPCRRKRRGNPSSRPLPEPFLREIAGQRESWTGRAIARDLQRPAHSRAGGDAVGIGVAVPGRTPPEIHSPVHPDAVRVSRTRVCVRRWLPDGLPSGSKQSPDGITISVHMAIAVHSHIDCFGTFRRRHAVELRVEEPDPRIRRHHDPRRVCEWQAVRMLTEKK